MQAEKSRGLATVAEAGQFLRVSRATLYRVLAQGDLRSLKVRGARRLRWADLEDYIGGPPRAEIHYGVMNLRGQGPNAAEGDDEPGRDPLRRNASPAAPAGAPHGMLDPPPN